MTDDDRLSRIEAMAAYALLASLYAASAEYRREQRVRRIKDALWPLF